MEGDYRSTSSVIVEPPLLVAIGPEHNTRIKDQNKAMAKLLYMVSNMFN